MKLADLRILATLGVGGFGRVELVQIAGDPTRSFALKQMKKSQVLTYLFTSLLPHVLLTCLIIYFLTYSFTYLFIYLITYILTHLFT